MLTLILIFAAIAAAAAVVLAVRVFQMDSPGGAREQLSTSLAPPLYAMNTKIDTLQQSLSAMLAAAVQTGNQTITASVGELKEEARGRVDEKLAAFATELRGTFDSLAQWLESRLGSRSEAANPAAAAQLRAAVEQRLIEVQNQLAASLDALHESVAEELRRTRTETRESLAGVQQSLVEAFRMLQASHESRLESLRRAVEEKLTKESDKSFTSFKESLAELHTSGERTDPAREKIR
ncbi:MAG TPA: hypothetical protein VGS20_08225 [Candidatus Acidoferrales bacterium]|nr:hypothetical protein [Candidatus Acidoferrales bacterium]